MGRKANKFFKNYSTVLKPIDTVENKKYRSLTYLGNMSTLIKKILEKEMKDIKISFASHCTVKNLLFNNKDKSNKLDGAGVYQLECQDCNGIYIGRTKRSFKQRLKEHAASFRNKDNKSMFANHLIEENHSFNFDYLKILHSINNDFFLNSLENMEIYRAKFNKDVKLLNQQTDFRDNKLYKVLKT